MPISGVDSGGELVAPALGEGSRMPWPQQIKSMPGMGQLLQAAGAVVTVGSSIPRKVANTAHTLAQARRGLWEDYSQSENKTRFGLAIGGILAYEVAGPARLPSILTTDLAFTLEDKLNFAGSSVLAAAPATALAVGWGWGAALTLSYAFDHMPRCFNALHNGITNKEKPLEFYPSLKIDRPSNGVLHRFGHGLKDGAGATAALAPQMYTAGVLGMSSEDRIKLSRRLGVSGGIFWGSCLGVLAGSAASLEKSNPELAANINAAAHDHLKLFLGFTALQIGLMLTQKPRHWAGHKLSQTAHKVAQITPEPIKRPDMALTIGLLGSRLAAKKVLRQMNSQSGQRSLA